jgi:hypothetical protein
MYLHMKTCTADPGVACPTSQKGCNDARKLITHYRRCREIRARQAGQHPKHKVQQHLCLVCSLVARHAKGVLDRNQSVNPRKPNSKHVITPYNLGSERKLAVQNPSGAPQSLRPRSTSPKSDRNRVLSSFTFSSNIENPTTPQKMPPPPPRFPGKVSEPVGIPQFSSTSRQDNQVGVTTVFPRQMVAPIEMLGKSLDSAGGFHRPRSESLDVRHTVTMSGMLPGENCRSPNLGLSEHDPQEPVETNECPVQTRRRSASLSVLSTVATMARAGFDTIFEEPLNEDYESVFDMDDFR